MRTGLAILVFCAACHAPGLPPEPTADLARAPDAQPDLAQPDLAELECKPYGHSCAGNSECCSNICGKRNHSNSSVERRCSTVDECQGGACRVDGEPCLQNCECCSF